tara:strand:+ start:81 stop:569 length:489 start_codon:yes stop_codon:yes gene_type:complete
MKNFVGLLILAFLFLVPFELFAAEKLPTVRLRVLATHIANKIVTEAVNDCATRGYLVSAAVVDRNGNLAAFLRNPLSGPHTIKVSQRKAYSSATLRADTSQMGARSDLSFAPEILLIVGGVTINFSGIFYGGVAVSGAKPDIDEECAKAGLEAVADIMDFVD